MKIYYFFLFFLFFSCSNAKKDVPKKILSKHVFESSLKEIHLAQASFEINKRKDKEYAKNQLMNSYLNIFKKYGLSKKSFEETLNYYSVNSEELEKIYIKILEQLNNEKSKLD